MLGQAQPVVAVEGYTGPFDLLVRLIERREVDVLAISLAEVTDQYLTYLTEVQRRDPEHLSAFLVVAAKLLWLKSTLLLPTPTRPAAEGPPEDPTDLSERLRTYQLFRQAAAALAARDEANLRSYPHPPVPYRSVPRPPTPPWDPNLLAAAFCAARSRPKVETPQVVDAEPRVSLAEAIAHLEQALQRFATVRFEEVVGEPLRQRLVATFLAVLELIRLGRLRAAQEERFGEITLARADSPAPRALPLPDPTEPPAGAAG